MSASRRARRQAERENKKVGKVMKEFIDLKSEQSKLESQFADTFREYGLDPYGKDSDQFQQALLTHGVK